MPPVHFTETDYQHSTPNALLTKLEMFGLILRFLASAVLVMRDMLASAERNTLLLIAMFAGEISPNYFNREDSKTLFHHCLLLWKGFSGISVKMSEKPAFKI